MEFFSFEEELFSVSEESQIIPENWSFIEETPQLNELKIQFVHLIVRYKNKFFKTTMEPSTLTNKYNLSELTRTVSKCLQESKNNNNSAFSNNLQFNFAGKLLKTDEQLNEAISLSPESNEAATLTLEAIEKQNESHCVMCLSSNCKHVKRANKKSRKRKKLAEDVSSEQILAPCSPQRDPISFSSASSFSLPKRRRVVVEESESDELSFNFTANSTPFSIIDPLGIYQLN